MIAACREAFERLFEETQAERWGLSREIFAATVERSARKRFPGAPSKLELENYLASLHAEDLALACACAEGIPAAWEEFVPNYRGYLRASAAAILRCPANAPEAVDLADSLFAELHGLADGKRGEHSLFRYFHGRSSLKTWLRAVLAQRHVDAIRAAKRFEPLEHGPDGEAKLPKPTGDGLQPLLDPQRGRYLEIFRGALEAALQKLDARDLERLRLYYAQEQTLAEIGRKLGEHESSVSRNLERVRRVLRSQVEESLRRGDFPLDGSALRKGMDEAQVELCFEYAAADAPIDLDKLLREREQTTVSKPRRIT
jgi:RNA polymerase sigma-70 factor (ECF subfamily)